MVLGLWVFRTVPETRDSPKVLGQYQASGILPKTQRSCDQKCTHLMYRSVRSLGGNVNTRRMLQPVVGSIFDIKNQ